MTAALEHVGATQTDLAEELGHRYPNVVNRWANAGCKRVVWYGILHALDLPKTWRPKEAR